MAKSLEYKPDEMHCLVNLSGGVIYPEKFLMYLVSYSIAERDVYFVKSQSRRR